MSFQAFVEFRAQAVVFRALMNMLERVTASQDELDPYEVLPVAVFMAFTVEAYINSIGFRKVPLWKHVERAPWKTKISILHEARGRTPDWGQMPLQLAPRIFSIRDHLAHGKPETVAGPVVESAETARAMLYVQHIKPPVLQGLTREWVLDNGEHLYDLLEYLGGLVGLDSEAFSAFSWGYTKEHSADHGPKA